MRIAIDLDNVLVSWQYHWMELYNSWYGTNLHREDCGTWDACLSHTHFNTMDEFYQWFEAADGWRTQPFVPGAQGFMYDLNRLAKVPERNLSWLFVTSRPTPAGKLAAKELAASLYGSMVAFAADDAKGQQNADIWIDDSPAVLESLARAEKKSIRFIHPWNDTTPDRAAAPSTYACYTWDEVMGVLVSAEGILQ